MMVLALPTASVDEELIQVTHNAQTKVSTRQIALQSKLSFSAIFSNLQSSGSLSY